MKKDIKNSFVMQSDGSYKREINGDSAFDCHQQIHRELSISKKYLEVAS